MKRLSSADIDSIAESYINLVRMTEIAAHYGLSRQRIWQVLQDAGVDTSKKGGLVVVCAQCKKVFKKPRCQVRKRLHCFCSNDCYYDWLAEKSAGYEPWRHGMRIARAIVFKQFNLKKEHVVHHEDGNNRNNATKNLKVFENQGDHLKYHRGFDVRPLWEGVNV